MAQLVISLGSLPILAFRVGEGATRLGRDQSNDIVLSLPEVAPFHAEIRRHGDCSGIHAMGDELLLVNGHSVEGAELSPGDVITLGGYRLEWLDEEPTEESDAGFPLVQAVRNTLPMGLVRGHPDEKAERMVVTEGEDLLAEIILRDPAILVGRSPDCDLVLRDESVSWRHASVEKVSDGIRIRDLGSSNGTFLEGSRIESAVAEPGDRVRLGRTTLQLFSPAHPRPASQEAEAAGDSARGLAELIGRSKPMRAVYQRIREAARGKLPVLILGETGSGKELAARALHMIGPRASGALVPVNCAALPRELVEAELFGHTRGAFTGAQTDRVGAFEAAAGGTIFLDEIAEFPLDLQPKLLRILDEGTVPRVGGKQVSVDFRVVAATNRNLRQEVSANRFRQDLFYRVAALTIQLPPLRERPEDLADLVHGFLATARENTGIDGAHRTRFEESALAVMAAYRWPGNVRELRNLVYRVVASHPGGVVQRRTVEELLAESAVEGPAPAAATGSLEDMEREAIRNALADCHGQRRAAARRLGIAESTLYDKIRRYGLGRARPAD
jgi:DNA-binding NtrC family response regulator